MSYLEKINPWLEEAIRRAEQRRRIPRGLVLIVEVEPGREDIVAQELSRIPGVKVLDKISGFLRVDVPDPSYIDTIARIDGVIDIAYDAPVWITAVDLDNWMKAIAARQDPLLRLLEREDLEALGIEVKPTAFIPPAIAALTPKVPAPPVDPLTMLTALTKSVEVSFNIGPITLKPSEAISYTIEKTKLPIPHLPVLHRPGVDLVLVTYTRRIIKAPSYYVIKRITTAVIDTGLSPHPAMQKLYKEISLVPEPPLDTMGHGQWCTTCAFGNRTIFCRYGEFVPVADSRNIVHIKIFMAFGPTSNWHVMKAMEIATLDFNAKVISMSLGGVLQGSVRRDPECKLLERLTKVCNCIFVVAAGNEGPKPWTLDSPGASPYALTVAAYSWRYKDVAWWSSRGPQGRWYRDHKSDYEEDIHRYGWWRFRKPDIMAPGGGPVKEHQKPIDNIVSGVTGWYDGYLDFVVDGWEGMRGTSMATPHMAGLVGILKDMYLEQLTVDRLKAALLWVYGLEKDIARGWGLADFPRIHAAVKKAIKQVKPWC